MFVWGQPYALAFCRMYLALAFELFLGLENLVKPYNLVTIIAEMLHTSATIACVLGLQHW